jgi:hypothetical protein
MTVRWPEAEKAAFNSGLQTLKDLSAYDLAGRPESHSVSFEFPEAVINLYLSISLKRTPRPGISSAQVELLPGNRVIVTAYIDFAHVMNGEPRIIPQGLLPKLIRARTIKAEFQFHVESRALTFIVRPIPSAKVDAPDVTAPVLEGIIRKLAIIQPEKFDTTRPIPLPFGLKKLYTGKNYLGGET